MYKCTVVHQDTCLEHVHATVVVIKSICSLLRSRFPSIRFQGLTNRPCHKNFHTPRSFFLNPLNQPTYRHVCAINGINICMGIAKSRLTWASALRENLWNVLWLWSTHSLKVQLLLFFYYLFPLQKQLLEYTIAKCRYNFIKPSQFLWKFKWELTFHYFKDVWPVKSLPKNRKLNTDLWTERIFVIFNMTFVYCYLAQN